MIQVRFKDGSVVEYPTGSCTFHRDGKLVIDEAVSGGGLLEIASLDLSDVDKVDVPN